DRWNTFADYAQQGASIEEQNMVLSGLLSIKNDNEDAALDAWRWGPEGKDEAVNAMLSAGSSEEYKGYNTLATYQNKGENLPLKVGVGVAIKFLANVGSGQLVHSTTDKSLQADDPEKVIEGSPDSGEYPIKFLQ
ncbi:hypothetical protein, partial [Xanthovirga aplysinae]|uniref:hypothetical protein n=1 Tax=Xanthovirga aplysinae TaxID=2529853 RepID=UPI001CA40016